MNKKLVKLLFIVHVFFGAHTFAEKLEKNTAIPEVFKSIPALADNTLPLVKDATAISASNLSVAVFNRPDFKNQASLGRDLSNAKLYNNSPFLLYIGYIGSTILYPIPAKSSIAVATPFNYLIYPANNASGPALFLTYHNNKLGTQNTVHTCCVQQGIIDNSIPCGPMQNFTGTAALYKDDVRPLGGVSIFIDGTKKNAFSLSSE